MNEYCDPPKDGIEEWEEEEEEAPIMKRATDTTVSTKYNLDKPKPTKKKKLVKKKKRSRLSIVKGVKSRSFIQTDSVDDLQSMEASPSKTPARTSVKGLFEEAMIEDIVFIEPEVKPLSDRHIERAKLHRNNTSENAKLFGQFLVDRKDFSFRNFRR